jgi:hypothetical protein
MIFSEQSVLLPKFELGTSGTCHSLPLATNCPVSMKSKGYGISLCVTVISQLFSQGNGGHHETLSRQSILQCDSETSLQVADVRLHLLLPAHSRGMQRCIALSVLSPCVTWQNRWTLSSWAFEIIIYILQGMWFECSDIILRWSYTFSKSMKSSTGQAAWVQIFGKWKCVPSADVCKRFLLLT